MNKNIKIIINYLGGPLVFGLLCWFIYRQVIHQHNWKNSLTQINEALHGPLQWKLWLAVAFMPLNWGIEARKWQVALRPVGGLPFFKAFKAILSGTTMASFTPNRMGEYLGRILYIKEGHRIQAISLTIVCSMAQMLVTLISGAAGLLYLRFFTGSIASMGPQWQLALDILLGLTGCLLIGIMFLYFRLSWVIGLLAKIPFAQKGLRYLKVLENFDRAGLLWILFLSFGRYIVFIVQYSLVFPVFGVSLGFGQVLGGMSVVFLVMAVVPTFTFLTELGLRWEASIQVLEVFSSNTLGIFAASFTIWLINLIIPALIGSLLIVSIKLFKNR